MGAALLPPTQRAAGKGLAGGEKRGLFFVKEFFCPAGTRAFSLFYILAAYAAGNKKRGLFFVKEFFCPAGTRAFSLFYVWAAYAAGGKAGPVMGLRPLLGPPCIPPEAPPSGFQLPWACEGCAASAAGASLAALG